MGLVERVIVVFVLIMTLIVLGLLSVVECSLTRLVEGFEIFEPILVSCDGGETQTGT